MKILKLMLLAAVLFWSGQSVLAKYLDDETDLAYYGFRYYNRTHGNWLVRDQLGERGSANLYGFVRNQSTGRIDTHGHVDLGFTTKADPTGGFDGEVSPWVVQWTVPPDSPAGFVIQHLDWNNDIYICPVPDGSRQLTDQQVWDEMGLPGHPVFHFWESWQYDGKSWINPRDSRDFWAFRGFHSNPRTGTIVIRGTAAFYEGTDLSSFGGGWGPDVSPLSHGLVATENAPNLPDTETVIERQMVIWWSSCCDDHESKRTQVWWFVIF